MNCYIYILFLFLFLYLWFTLVKGRLMDALEQNGLLGCLYITDPQTTMAKTGHTYLKQLTAW